MKKIPLVVFLFLLAPVSCMGFTVLAQPVPVNPATSITLSVPAQPLQSPLPELPPTQRSKLEIIQYILLSFAVGASLWLLLRLEKTEQDEVKENKEEA